MAKQECISPPLAKTISCDELTKCSIERRAASYEEIIRSKEKTHILSLQSSKSFDFS